MKNMIICEGHSGEGEAEAMENLKTEINIKMDEGYVTEGDIVKSEGGKHGVYFIQKMVMK